MALAAELTTTPEPTAEAGTGTAPVAGVTAEPQTPATPARTFTQADVDRIAENERKRAERAYQRELEQLRSTAQPSTSGQPETDPAIRAQIEAIVGPIVAPVRQQQVEISLDRAVTSLGKRYPEFTDEAKTRQILETVMDLGLERATHLPIETVLELAFRHWKHEELSKAASVDIEAIKRQAADEAIKGYTAKKVETASKTPRPEGSGGGTASTNGDRRERSRSRRGALEAALERVTKEKQLTD